SLFSCPRRKARERISTDDHHAIAARYRWPALDGGLIRLEVALRAGDQVAALPCLRVFEAARRVVLADYGKEQMDRIRRLMAELWAVGEINELIRPDFVQFIGDNVQDGTEQQFDLFEELTSRLHVPWYALVGDHDVLDDPRAGNFSVLVGDPTGALSLSGFRF